MCSFNRTKKWPRAGQVCAPFCHPSYPSVKSNLLFFSISFFTFTFVFFSPLSLFCCFESYWMSTWLLVFYQSTNPRFTLVPLSWFRQSKQLPPYPSPKPLPSFPQLHTPNCRGSRGTPPAVAAVVFFFCSFRPTLL